MCLCLSSPVSAVCVWPGGIPESASVRVCVQTRDTPHTPHRHLEQVACAYLRPPRGLPSHTSELRKAAAREPADVFTLGRANIAVSENIQSQKDAATAG